MRITRLSKRLAYLLRHSSLPDRNGWVGSDLLARVLDCSVDDLKTVVSVDDKGRFEFSADEGMLRALYGHSADVDMGLPVCTPPDVLYHGTATKYLDRILSEGVRSRSRNFVHLSCSGSVALEIGRRHGAPVVLMVDAASAFACGIAFYRTSTGVWLADSVPAEYLRVVHIGSDEDGQDIFYG